MPNPTFIPMIKWDTFSAPNVITFVVTPEEDPFNEKLMANWSRFIANSGVMKVQRNFIEVFWNVTVTFLTSTEHTALVAFFDDWASYGKSFRYFPSYESATYYTVQLANPELVFDRIVADGAGDFLYKTTLKLRRAYQ